ncbi:MarR family winged helix-turn-helix transcriptional regulator [Dactylosporangium sp. CS-033363]|uniref:MarR family winged helix-turn-helix transcriptional regulator n=1 Tax=Dactylosporangium sp. CS-033363 TaxID=3239935 RepID=UPI003D927FD3
MRTLPTRLLSLAAMHSDRRVNEGLAGAGARKWHYAVLATLIEDGPASQAQLSERTGIFRSDIVAVVNELVERGQAERAPNPADRRQNVVTVTRAGRTQFKRLDQLIAEAEEDMFGPLSADERAELVRMLTVLLQHHGRG